MRVAGLDLAKTRDHSALVILTVERGRLVVERALRLPHVDYREQVAAMTPLLREMRLVAYDAGGVGSAVGELLPKDAVPVTIVSGDHVSQHGMGWHIGKQRLIGDLLHLSRAGRLMVPPECPGAELLRAELQDFIIVPSRRGVRLQARGGGPTIWFSRARWRSRPRDWRGTAIRTTGDVSPPRRKFCLS